MAHNEKRKHPGGCFLADLLLAEQAAQTAQGIAQLIQAQLGFDAVDERLHLIIGQVNAQNVLQSLDGLGLKLVQQVLVGFELVPPQRRVGWGCK